MSTEESYGEPEQTSWLSDALKKAKESALPILLQMFVDPDDDNWRATLDATVDAVELSLLSITGDITETKLRESLRMICVPLAETIPTKWESVADAIIGVLEWIPPDKKTHILDSWR